MPRFFTFLVARPGLLTLLVWLSALLAAQAQQRPAPAGALPAGADQSLSGALLPNGTLRPGATGSFDATGYRMGTDPATGAPVFRTAGAGDENWQAPPGAGLNGQVRALAVSGTNVYVGGDFSDAGGNVNADRVARWDGTTWQALGTGLNSFVRTLAVSGTDVYVGGDFTDAGGNVNADRVARWDGTAWQALGTGINSYGVYALAVSGTNVYVGGLFADAGGVANTNSVAKWNGTAWSALGTGLIGNVYALAVNGPDVYVGGLFNTFGGAAGANYVAKWNGTAWSALGSGLDNRVLALAVSGTDLYVGGLFTNAGGVAGANFVAKWNGTAWSALGTPGLNFFVYALALSGSDVYAGGSFTTAGGAAGANFVAKWNGTAWNALGSGLNNQVIALAVGPGTKLNAGGQFTAVGDDSKPLNYFGIWTPPLPLTITGLSPTRNLRNAARLSSVAITFDQPMSGSAASVGAVKVFSQQRGGRMSGTQGGAASASGNTLTFDPTTDFQPGERVMTTITTAAQSSGGANLAAGHVYGFTAAAGVGPGTFSGGSDPGVGRTPTSMAVGDVDGDGDLDLLTSNFQGNQASVRLNDGSGTFSGGSDPIAGGLSFSVAVGDVDGDGDLDLLATGSGGMVNVRLNDGSGTFSGGSDVLVRSVNDNPISVAVGDVDGDGDLDLLAALPSENTVSVRLNDGSGNFSGGSAPAVGAAPFSVAVGDVDGDGDLDLLTANLDANTVSVRLNDGSGTFSGGSDPGVGAGPRSVAVGDVDGDGDLDLLTANNTANTVSVRLNNGSGNFSGGSDPGVGAGPNSVAVGDVDGDGDLDLLAANRSGNTVSVRLNDGSGNFSGGSDPVVGNSPRSVAVGDVDSDGDLDLLVANGASNTVSVRLNQVPDLTVGSAQSISGTYNSVTVTATGVATLSGSLSVTTALTVQAGGVLNTSCQALTGPGTFTLEAGATLGICDAAGISATGATGAVQVTGARSFASDATYVYNGTAAQVTGPGLPATVRELETANAAGVSLSQPVAVTDVLRLTSGTLTTSGQPLTLRSTASRTAYAVHAGGTSSGNVTVQRYVGGPAAVGYRHLSSPVQSTTVADLTTAGYTPKVNAAYNNLPYVAPPVAVYPNILGYDETRGGTTPAYAGFATGYYSPAALSSVLTSGRGWSVAMAGALTPDFVGALRTGSVVQLLTLTGINTSPNTQKAGWALLGNPYAQPIDWDLATPGPGPGQIPTGMSSSISVYRTSGGNSGIYLTRANGLGSLPNGEVALGQGFFARATASTTFTFTNALRVEANPATVARPAVETRPRLTLTLHAVGAPTVETDEATVYFQTSATAGLDARFDGEKPAHNVGVPTLVSLTAEGDELAVNGLPETALVDGHMIPLLVDLPAAGRYELAVGKLLNLAGQEVALVDQLTGTRYVLAKEPVVRFTANQPGEVRGRFALVIGPAEAAAPGLVLYPNPAHGVVRVMLPAEASSVELCDATGRVVCTVEETRGIAFLRLDGLPAGIYVVRAAGQTQRLVVK